MKQLLILASVMSMSVLSAPASAAAAFNLFKCDAVLGDSVTAKNDGKNVNFSWTAKGSKDVFPLLRSFASTAISDNLLKAYNNVKIDVAFPVAGCSFDQNQIGKFQCAAAKDLVITLKASTGPSAASDTYRGKISSSKLSTQFSKKFGSDFLKFNLQAVAGQKKLSVDSDAFFATYHSADGSSHAPDCTVDFQPVVISN
jgi:hypothetical protein